MLCFASSSSLAERNGFPLTGWFRRRCDASILVSCDYHAGNRVTCSHFKIVVLKTKLTATDRSLVFYLLLDGKLRNRIESYDSFDGASMICLSEGLQLGIKCFNEMEVSDDLLSCCVFHQLSLEKMPVRWTCTVKYCNHFSCFID